MRAVGVGTRSEPEVVRRIVAEVKSIVDRREAYFRRNNIDSIETYRARLTGRKAVIYVGGAFKTISLIKALRLLGIETVVAGSQTGRPEDYDTIDLLDELSIADAPEQIQALVNGDNLVVTNRTQGRTLELSLPLSERQAKILLAGGLLNFTRQEG